MRSISIAACRARAQLTKPDASEVAKFKDETSLVPRVVAASKDMVIYSLKNRSWLRVLIRKPDTPQLGYKQHTASVTGVQFVNVRSNIVASISLNELLVWYIDDNQEIYTYFTFPASVVSFAWVPTANQPPDLLVMMGQQNESVSEVAILKSSALILRSAPQEEGGKIRKPDGTLKADRSHILTLRRDVTCSSPQASASSPVLAFSISETAIVTASLGNTDAPGWEPCQGERVQQFMVMSNELLIAVGSSAVFIWDVEGEPTPLQQLLLGPRGCTAFHCTTDRVVLYLTTGNPGGCEAMVLRMQPKAGAVAAGFYDVNVAVSAKNACAISGPNGEPRLHVDFANVLKMIVLDGAPWTDLEAAEPRAAPFSPKSPLTQPPATESNPSPNVVAIGDQPISSPPMSSMRALRPPSKLSDGLPSTAQIDALKSHIDAALSNTKSVMSVASTVVLKDHENLVQEALKVQSRLVSEALNTMPAAPQYAASIQNAFDGVIRDISKPTAQAMIEGISSAIDEQLRAKLEATLRTALNRQVKKKNRESAQDVTKILDTALTEAMSQVQNTVVQKQSAYASLLIHFVSDVASEGWNAAQQLQNIIQLQQQQIEAFTRSGVLDEVKALREMVVELKKRSGADGEAAQLPKETVLANAAQQLAEGNFETGLQWVLHYNDPESLQQLLSSCSAVNRNAMLEHGAVSEATWSRVTALLVSIPKQETLKFTLDWLCEIIAGHSELTKNDQLMSSVHAYMNVWKSSGAILSSEVKGKLRELYLLARK